MQTDFSLADGTCIAACFVSLPDKSPQHASPLRINFLPRKAEVPAQICTFDLAFGAWTVLPQCGNALVAFLR